MACSVARSVDVVGEWWTTLILREAFMGVRRFDELQRNLGIARNILSTRLSHLVEKGVLERHRYQDRPERYEYRLTEKGLDLYPIVIALMRWGDKWTAEEAGVPLVLRHRDCGHDMHPQFSCDVCGGELDPKSVAVLPGPGAPQDQLDRYPRMRTTPDAAPVATGDEP